MWEAIGREEQIVSLMNSMHKNVIGFREVEDSVQRIEDIKWSCSSKVSKGGGRGQQNIYQVNPRLRQGILRRLRS